MKKKSDLVRFVLFVAAMSTTLAGCSVIEGIFKAGVWVGILLVVVVIAIILFIVGKASK